MIRTARFRASCFNARLPTFDKKSDHPPRRLRKKDDAHYSIDHSDSFAARSFADLAVQHRLGLLSKRRARIDSVDRDNSRPGGATLI